MYGYKGKFVTNLSAYVRHVAEKLCNEGLPITIEEKAYDINDNLMPGSIAITTPDDEDSDEVLQALTDALFPPD
jgi:hypothetical protein